MAKVQLALAKVKADGANEDFRRAKAALKAAEDALHAVKNPPKAVEKKEVNTFTIDVRTPTAAEKVIPVKATGNQTVVDALKGVGYDAPPKADDVSVWVFDGKKVLPVDLSAIHKDGNAKTNYALKAGD